MVGDAALREVVGADALRPIPRADHEFSCRGFLGLLGRHLAVSHAGGQDLHGLLFVLVLAAVVLALGHDAGGQVGDAHSRLGLVHVLPPRTTGPEDINAQFIGGEVHLADLIDLGQHGHGAGRGVDAALGLGGRHALHPVATRFKLHARIDALAGQPNNHLPVAAEVRGVGREHLGLPAVALGIPQVHAQQVAGEQGGLIAAGAGPNLEDDVALVVRVFGQEQPLKVAASLRHGLAQPPGFIVGKGLELWV